MSIIFLDGFDWLYQGDPTGALGYNPGLMISQANNAALLDTDTHYGTGAAISLNSATFKQTECFPAYYNTPSSPTTYVYEDAKDFTVGFRVKFRQASSDIILGFTSNDNPLVEGNPAYFITFAGVGTGSATVSIEHYGTLVQQVLGTWSAPLQLNVWQHLEFRIVLDPVTGSIELRVDETTAFAYLGLTIDEAHTYQCIKNFLYAGLLPSTSSFDDLYILKNDGQSPSGFQGDCQVLIGAHTGQNSDDGGLNWSMVNSAQPVTSFWDFTKAPSDVLNNRFDYVNTGNSPFFFTNSFSIPSGWEVIGVTHVAQLGEQVSPPYIVQDFVQRDGSANEKVYDRAYAGNSFNNADGKFYALVAVHDTAADGSPWSNAKLTEYQEGLPGVVGSPKLYNQSFTQYLVTEAAVVIPAVPILRVGVEFPDPRASEGCVYTVPPTTPVDVVFRDPPAGYKNTIESDGEIKIRFCQDAQPDLTAPLVVCTALPVPNLVFVPPILNIAMVFGDSTWEQELVPLRIGIEFPLPSAIGVSKICGELNTPYQSLVESALLDTPYIAREGVRSELLSVSYAAYVQVGLLQSVGFTVPVSAAFLETPYELELRGKVKGELETGYALLVQAGLDTPYGFLRTVYTEVSTPYSLNVSVATELSAPYDILAVEEIRAALQTPYTLMASSVSTVISPDDFYLVSGTTRFTLNAVSIDMDEEGFAWTMSADIKDASDFSLLTLNTEFELHYLGEVFDFLVEDRNIDRGELTDGSIESYSISGISPTAALDLPRSLPYTNEWLQTTTALTVVQEVLADNNFTRGLIWEIQDWSIPGRRVSIEEGAPIAVLQDIAKASGAVVNTTKSGEIRIRYLSEVCPTDWNADTSDFTLTDSENIYSFSGSYEVARYYNSVRVRDIVPTFSDSIEWVPDEAANGEVLRGDMKVFLGPFRDGTRLLTTGAAIISGGAAEVFEFTEDVEFLKSEGSVSKPIDAISEVVWYTDDLGTVSFDKGSTGLVSSSSDLYYSVARVTYTSKALVYRIEYREPIPAGESVPSQFLVEDTLYV